MTIPPGVERSRWISLNPCNTKFETAAISASLVCGTISAEKEMNAGGRAITGCCKIGGWIRFAIQN